MASGSVCLLRIRHQEYYTMNNQQKFQDIVEAALAESRGRFDTTKSLSDHMTRRIANQVSKGIKAGDHKVLIGGGALDSSHTLQGKHITFRLQCGDELLRASIAAEGYLNALKLDWRFSEVSNEAALDRINHIITNFIPMGNDLDAIAENIARCIWKEFPEFMVYYALDKDGTFVVYFLHQRNLNVAMVGSCDLTEHFPGAVTKSTQYSEVVTLEGILDKLTSPTELRSGGAIQRTPESLFIATKTYLRNLRDYYRAAFPFTYQLLWATSTDALAKPVLDLIGDSELALISESDLIISIIEKKIGDDAELRNKFMQHVKSPMHISTHVMVRVTDEAGNTKSRFLPIAGMVRASAAWEVNTNNPHLALWVEPSFNEVEPLKPVNPRNRLEDYVTDMVEKLGGQFGKGSVFVPRLKANIATLWGSVIENHGNAQLGFQAPFRMVSAIIADFALWLGSRGRELMMLESHDFGMEVTPTSFAIEVIFTDWSTGRTETVLFTYADLDGQIKAGLDWHPDAPTFFIPREF